ncbi:MAG: hypothetical protein Q8Q59_11860 [Luteolibacter sp.]|jgi:hypothetical protein|nr:hypothetical protein [Luteolibacter sp.]
MNARLALTFVTLAAMPSLAAQIIAQTPYENPLLETFSEFQPDEETVAAAPDPFRKPPVPALQEESAPPPAAVSPEAKPPVLVIGKAPEGAILIPQTETPAPPAGEEIVADPTPGPRPGLAVRVEALKSGSGTIDPAQVKLLAPFPAKLLAQTPAGWKIESSDSAPPFSHEVRLSSGKNITLSVRPHRLVPEADGSSVFQVSEPGFNAPLGYRQDATVGAVLSSSIRQLDNDAKRLGGVIDQLQQLVVSLPQPEPATESAPPVATPVRKR